MDNTTATASGVTTNSALQNSMGWVTFMSSARGDVYTRLHSVPFSNTYETVSSRYGELMNPQTVPSLSSLIYPYQLVTNWKSLPAGATRSVQEFGQLLNTVNGELSQDEVNEVLIEERVLKWLDGYEPFALEIILKYFRLGLIRDSVMSKFLEVLGLWRSRNKAQVEFLFRNFVQSELPSLRYGSVIGISNTANPSFIQTLEVALEKEQVQYLKGILTSTVEYLKKEEDHEISSTRD